jgi:GTP-binding protein EngB required for normal cell division
MQKTAPKVKVSSEKVTPYANNKAPDSGLNILKKDLKLYKSTTKNLQIIEGTNQNSIGTIPKQSTYKTLKHLKPAHNFLHQSTQPANEPKLQNLPFIQTQKTQPKKSSSNNGRNPDIQQLTIVYVMFGRENKPATLNLTASLSDVRVSLQKQIDIPTRFEFLYGVLAIDKIDESETILNEVVLKQENKTILQIQILQTPRKSIKRPSTITRELEKKPLGLKRVDELSGNEKQLAKYILIVGETGVGKSTLINMIANYVMGVKFEDNYRYEVIPSAPAKDQSKSQTQTVAQYCFSRSPISPFPIVLIDTPGYGDTAGLEKDKKIDEMIKRVLKETETIHMIAFTCKASTTRFTACQVYIWNKMKAMLKPEYLKRIKFWFTFCDAAEPQVVSQLSKSSVEMQNLISDLGPNWYFKFNNSTLYHKQSTSNPFTQLYWQFSSEGVSSFLSALSSQKRAADTIECSEQRPRPLQATSTGDMNRGLAIRVVQRAPEPEEMKTLRSLLHSMLADGQLKPQHSEYLHTLRGSPDAKTLISSLSLILNACQQTTT